MAGNKLMSSMVDLANQVVAQSAEQGALPSLYGATMPDVQGGEYYGPNGPGEMRGSPKKVTASRRAQSPEDAARLWARSEELTGVTFDWSSTT